MLPSPPESISATIPSNAWLGLRIRIYYDKKNFAGVATAGKDLCVECSLFFNEPLFLGGKSPVMKCENRGKNNEFNILENGPSLIKSKYNYTEPFRDEWRCHPCAGQQCHWLWALTHTLITWSLPPFKTQKPARWPPISASGQGKEKGHTQGCMAAAPGRGGAGRRGRRRLSSASKWLLCP